MLAGIRNHLLQRRQLIVEISTLLIHEREAAPDIEVIGKFRGRFLKKISRPLYASLGLFKRDAPRHLSLLSQRNVAWAGFLRRDIRLALVKIIIRARDPCVGIVRRLLPPFGEQRLDLPFGMLINQLSVTMRVFLSTRHFGLRLDGDEALQNFLKRAGIFLVISFVARCEDDIADSLWKLDVSHAFPLRVSLCG